MHGLILPFKGILPRVADDAFIAPGAVLVGDVEVGSGASVWYNAVLRGDIEAIRVGAGSNIQDGAVIHTERKRPCEIGDDVLVGHRTLLHGCVLEDRAFIGMGATVMDGVVVEGGAMVAAGALVTSGKRVATGQLWAGSPAVHRRALKPEEIEMMLAMPRRYAERAVHHRESLAGVTRT
jgi:carbonic anhydrase/acetyltransferase-like protein (isoleucine patch superfamily)